VGHENQLGAQQADAFGALLHHLGDAVAFADVGEHLDGMAITGDGRSKRLAQAACRRCSRRSRSASAVAAHRPAAPR
jgi:hypothetical protein